MPSLCAIARGDIDRITRSNVILSRIIPIVSFVPDKPRYDFFGGEIGEETA
jgi:hypothetical protein